jgi:N-acetyl-anhydromuramyl-L-alanine amidase AmpD
MATTLEDAIRRRQLEEALSHLDTGAAPLDTTDTSTPAPEEVPSGSDYPASESGQKIKVPKEVKGEYGDWNKWSTLDQAPAGHIDLAPPGPTPTPESSFGPDLQTDPETGTRYVTDPSVASGLVPFAELATEADKEKFKPTDVTLPKVVSEATAPVTYPTIAEDQPLSLPPDPREIWQQYRDGKISRDEAIAQAAQLQEQVKRATLVQFPKGEPATMPWHPAGQKPVPGFVEGSQNAILNPAAGVIPPTPAPDKLTQVERGELVSTPSGTAPKAVGVAAPVTYPTIAEDQGAPGTPPKVQPAQPVTGPQPSGPKAPGTHTELAPPGQMDLRPDEPQTVQPAVQPTPSTQPPSTAQPAVKPAADDWKTWTTVDGTPAEPPQVTTQPSGPAPSRDDLNINTDHPAVNYYTPGRGKNGIQGIVLHASDGREGGDINTLTGHDKDHQVSSNYYVTRDGRIYQFVPDGDTAWHAGRNLVPVHGKVYDNSNTIGIEQEHYDGKEEWSPAQVAATARLVAMLKAKYGLKDNDIIGHSDIAPERKQDPYNYPWKEFRAAVNGAVPDTTTTSTSQTGEVASQLDSQLGGLLKNKGAVFAEMGAKYNVNPRLIAAIAMEETGNGTSHLLATRNNIGGITGPGHTGKGGDYMSYDSLDEGIEAAAKHLRERYLDQGLTTIKDIGAVWAPPDAENDPQGTNRQWPGAVTKFYAALGGTGDLQGKVAAQAKKQDWESWATLSPAEETAAQTAARADQQKQIGVLDDLNRSTQNPGQLWKTLNQPIPGVSDANRKAYQDNFKQQLTKYAQDHYGEPDPDKAFNRAVGDPSFGAFGQDLIRGAISVAGQTDVGLNQAAKYSDFNILDGFAKVLHPESDGMGRAAFIKTITDIKDPGDRSRMIGKLWASLDPQKQASIDINGLVQSAQNVSSPQYQASQNADIANKKALVEKLVTPDPSLKGTIGEWGTQGGQVLANIAMTGLPKILQTSAFAGQIYGATMDRIKQEHPDWTDQQISSNAATSTVAQLAPQEALMALSHGILAPLYKWMGAAANPVARFGIGGGIHLATGAAGGAIMQAGANIAEGQPIGQDVGQAAIGGVIQAAPFAVHGAIHGVLSPPEAPTKAPLGQEPVTPPPETGPAGGAVRGAQPETMATGGQEATAGAEAASAQPIEGNAPVTPPSPVVTPPVVTPIQGLHPDNEIKVGVNPLTKNLQIYLYGREGQRGALPLWDGVTREEAEALAENLRQRGTGGQYVDPGLLNKAFNRARERSGQSVSEARETAINAIFGPEKPAPTSTSTASVTQEAVARRAYELYEERTKSGQPGTAADDYTQAQKELSQATEPPPATVSEAEPIKSAIANRYVQERMAAGELGQIDPSEGQSTEDMVKQGLQMSRDQREGLIKNFMKGQGGDLDQQGAAIRAREAILSEQARSASRAANADPTNPQLQSQAKVASDAVTAFHNGPIKKFKQVWSNAGRGLQREIPLDYTTLNGMKEAYLKGQGKGNEAPPELEPKLKKMADTVSKSADTERAAMNNYGKEVGDYVEKKSRGKVIPNDDQIRTRLMEIMKHLPCRT